ncbi:MAG: hypothetical protein IPG81_05890 [Sandaracinaceae bacterium]|nr:hypothetical protein [Sandaracinaceae bacterium]
MHARTSLLALAGLLVLGAAACRSTGPAPTASAAPAGSAGDPHTASAPPEPAPRVLATSPVARLLLPAKDLFREEGNTFSVRFRVSNLTNHSLHLDLASPTLVGPQQWGPLTTEARQVVDEMRHNVGELSVADREALRAALRAGTLTELPAGESLDVYVPFHGADAQMFMGFATPWVFVSLDGALDVVDPQGEATRLSLAWTDTRGNADTDIVHRMPVVLAERDCRRERSVQPRQGSPEWPVVYCRVR